MLDGMNRRTAALALLPLLCASACSAILGNFETLPPEADDGGLDGTATGPDGTGVPPSHEDAGGDASPPADASTDAPEDAPVHTDADADSSVPCGAMNEACCGSGSPCHIGLSCETGPSTPAHCTNSAPDLGHTCSSGSVCSTQLCPVGQGTCSIACPNGNSDCTVSGWSCGSTTSGGTTLNACLCTPALGGAVPDPCNGTDDNCDGTVDESGNLDCENHNGPASRCQLGGCACTGTVCTSGCMDTSNDYNNCGHCDHACNGPGGGVCAGGKCQPYDFASMPTGHNAGGLAVDDGFIYWTANLGGSYGRVQVCGNGPGKCSGAVDFMAASPNATSGLPGAAAVAVAPSSNGSVVAVGAGISDGMSYGGGRMESCAAPSGIPTTCSPTVEGSNGGGTGGFFTRVATDGTNIAALDYLEIYLSTVGHASENSAAMVVAYNAVPGANNQLIDTAIGATSGTPFVYWSVAENNGNAGPDAHKIFRCQIGGGTYKCGTGAPLAKELVYDGGTTRKNPGALVFDTPNGRLYWVDQGSAPFPPPNAGDGQLLVCDVSTLPCTPTVLAQNLPSPVSITQDPVAVYYGTSGFGTGLIQGCAKNGGCGLNPLTLASGESGIQSVAADPFTGGSLYWTTSAVVRRVAKP
jgi:hypothetical protein